MRRRRSDVLSKMQSTRQIFVDAESSDRYAIKIQCIIYFIFFKNFSWNRVIMKKDWFLFGKKNFFVKMIGKDLSLSTSGRQGKIFPRRPEAQLDKERTFLVDLRLNSTRKFFFYKIDAKAWNFPIPGDKLIFHSL